MMSFCERLGAAVGEGSHQGVLTLDEYGDLRVGRREVDGDQGRVGDGEGGA